MSTNFVSDLSNNDIITKSIIVITPPTHIKSNSFNTSISTENSLKMLFDTQGLSDTIYIWGKPKNFSIETLDLKNKNEEDIFYLPIKLPSSQYCWKLYF